MATLGARPATRRRGGGGGQALPSWQNPDWGGGYNSFAASASMVKDNEVSRGQNERADDNGAMSRRLGSAYASPALQAGYAVAALGQLKKAGTFVKLSLQGTSAYAFTDSTATALTGFAFTPSAAPDCTIFQAIGRSYFTNGTDQPYYTSDGATLTLQSGAFPMRSGVFYNQRLYCLRPAYPDRIYFSNPLSVDPTTTGSEPATYSAGNFGTFAVDLAASPIKNAGFVSLGIDEGVVVQEIVKKNGTIYIYTAEHGEWQMAAASSLNANGTVGHTVQQIIASGGSPAPKSMFVSDNDQLFYGWDNLYFLGEVALYQNQRVTPKSGRVQSEMRNVPPSAQRNVVGVAFKNADYVFYTSGSYNDRCIVRDHVIDAWSVPYVGWNVSCAFVYVENDGRRRLLTGSSNSAVPRVIELEVGSDDCGAAIDSQFGDKNTDCGLDGLVKRFAFTRVFFASIIGSITVDWYVDGAYQNSYTYTAPGGSGQRGGVGSMAMGLGAVGRDGSGSGGAAVGTKADSFFEVPHNFTAGEKIQLVYRDATPGNYHRITRRKTYYKPGNFRETLT